ncbi:hypothetical protein [Longimicrobium terrae]|uniref:SWIM-type domain-containing protein n=1 Tax=Longimicrobium terrae TaxID=1639882 RepID=A0A841GWC6_9BACT|nr:hypothetical protein [Longimicrobium terrae]MBB4635932.1 hypothetical protein [Longimicrobium terrae]MBB6070328.1 hypothetical protein [Longimicrobium terrae]NNC30829.1 hypothetical protein [Longimicrobium terrae]
MGAIGHRTTGAAVGSGGGPVPPDISAEHPLSSGDDVLTGHLAFGIELGRLARALPLQANSLGGRRFRVMGGAEPHYVDLSPCAPLPCDCGDLAWRGGPREGPCKHMLRARLVEGDPVVVRAVAVLVGGLGELAAGLERRLRGTPIRLTRGILSRGALAAGYPLEEIDFRRTGPRVQARVELVLRSTGVSLGHLVRTPEGIEFVR